MTPGARNVAQHKVSAKRLQDVSALKARALDTERGHIRRGSCAGPLALGDVDLHPAFAEPGSEERCAL